jgi:hypothetical protein
VGELAPEDPAEPRSAPEKQNVRREKMTFVSGDQKLSIRWP